MPRSKRKKSTNKSKGDIVEEVVTMMHRSKGVRVEHDIRLSTKDGTGQRQVDVLLTSQVAGYAVRFAIECKNYNRPLHRKDVENFAGLLEDVGIPTQYGILVAAGDIGGGAIHRARSYGMKLLSLTGLTSNRLASHVEQALQSIIFIVPQVTKLSMTNNIPDSKEAWQQMLFLYDEEEQLRGFLPDLVWQKWVAGEPPSVIGEYEVNLDVPEGWHHRIDNKCEPLLSAQVVISVGASVISIPGQASQHTLVDPMTGNVERLRAKANFQEQRTEYPVDNFSTEEQLQQFLDARTGAVKLAVGRFRVPRVRVGSIFWPPSERVMRIMHDFQHRYETGEAPLPSPQDLAGVEEGNLRNAWEPIYPDHPMLRNI